MRFGASLPCRIINIGGNTLNLHGKLITTQEAERTRLARELHDDITQRLAILNIEVDQLELQHQSLSEPVKERVRQIGDNLGELASDIQSPL